MITLGSALIAILMVGTALLLLHFERRKDNGLCHFRLGGQDVTTPVSRSRLAELREALGV